MVPVTWLLITLVFNVTDRFTVEKETIEVINDHLDSNNGNSENNNNGNDVEGDTYEGRRPRQSLEDNKVQESHQDHAQRNFLLPPGNPQGWGELGKPVRLSNLTDEQQKMVKQGWEKNAFNQYVSDLISLHRSLPDVRGRG